jgi:1,4-alpha-glucan branching enzyme
MRKSEHETLVCVFNFTPVVRANYRIGLPTAGRWKELLNSDAVAFGGGNQGNNGAVTAENQPWMNQPCSAELTLPPLAALVLRCEN